MKKKPEVPPSEQLIEHLSEYDLAVGELALALRSLVLEEAPGANETIYKGYALSFAFSFTEKWSQFFCYIGVYSRHVDLGFPWGSQLPDPDDILIGSGKRFRHIKIQRPEDLKKPYLRTFIRAAIELSEADRPRRPAKTASGRRSATAKSVRKK